MSVAGSAAAPRFRMERLLAETLRELRLLAPFLILVAIYIASVYGVSRAFGLEALFRIGLYNDIMRISAILSLPVGAAVYLLHLALVQREQRPLARLRRDIESHLLSPPAMLGIIVPLVAISLLVSSFSSFKGMIPQINPFHWDASLARLDEALHGGIAPWRISHAVFGTPAATLAINFAYNAWLFVMWIFLFGHILPFAGRAGRARYLLAFALCWIVVGSLVALALSSAGPVYYGRVTGLGDAFAPLMASLGGIDAGFAEAGGYWRIWSLDTQETLWTNYTASSTTLGSGISAMPSMHLSMATLMALAAWRIDRRFGWLMAAYAALILIGSVHLGWHYAIDGYVAIALTIALWRLAGRMVRDNMPASSP